MLSPVITAHEKNHQDGKKCTEDPLKDADLCGDMLEVVAKRKSSAFEIFNKVGLLEAFGNAEKNRRAACGKRTAGQKSHHAEHDGAGGRKSDTVEQKRCDTRRGSKTKKAVDNRIKKPRDNQRLDAAVGMNAREKFAHGSKGGRRAQRLHAKDNADEKKDELEADEKSLNDGGKSVLERHSPNADRKDGGNGRRHRHTLDTLAGLDIIHEQGHRDRYESHEGQET